MKKSQKYLLYLSIPAIFALAFFAYNSLIKDKGAAIATSNNKPQSATPSGRQSKSLPVSVHIATKG